MHTQSVDAGQKVSNAEDRVAVVPFGGLQRILCDASLALYAQKIVPLQRPEVPAEYELLPRGLVKEQGNPGRSSLLPAAPRHRMESAIDLWVLERALADSARYRTALLAGGISLLIKISEQSLADETFLERARRSIQRSNVLPQLITFEIAESAAVRKFDRAITFIHTIAALGCRSALNDFGTGLASPKHLKRLRVNRVKIDRSLVIELLTNRESIAATRAIVSLARELRIQTVAEGADKQETLERLCQLGIAYAQGSAVQRPRPFREVLEGLRTAQSASLQALPAGITLK